VCINVHIFEYVGVIVSDYMKGFTYQQLGGTDVESVNRAVKTFENLLNEEATD
jgi:hypothetical protein